jgi:hypothetical protein
MGQVYSLMLVFAEFGGKGAAKKIDLIPYLAWEKMIGKRYSGARLD